MLDGFGMFKSLRFPLQQTIALPSVKGTISLGKLSSFRYIQFAVFHDVSWELPSWYFGIRKPD